VLDETGIAKAMFAARSCLEQHRFQMLMHEKLKAWFSRYFEDDKQRARVCGQRLFPSRREEKRAKAVSEMTSWRKGSKGCATWRLKKR
jgi:hypothetical protein